MPVFKSPKRKIFRKKKDVDDLILFSDMLVMMVEEDDKSFKWFTDSGTRFRDTNGWMLFKDCLKKLLPLFLVFLAGCSVTPVTKSVPPVPKAMAHTVVLEWENNQPADPSPVYVSGVEASQDLSKWVNVWTGPYSITNRIILTNQPLVRFYRVYNAIP